MKTKMTIRIMGAFVTIIALLMFVVIGCSKDDNDDELKAFEPGYVWEAGDYPSLTAPYLNDSPTIGDPIIAVIAKHSGDFNPMLKRYLGREWHGSVSYNKSTLCGGDTRGWSETGEIWNNELPSQRLTFDLYAICGDETFTFSANHFDWNLQRRLLLMQNGQWNEGEYGYSRTDGNKTFRTYFKQVLNHPDLFIGVERDWIYESGTDVMEHEGTHSVKTYTKTGVENFEETTFSQTLKLGTEATYGAVSANLNATFSSNTTHNVKITSWNYSEKTTTYTIPADETWRFLTLHGIERYFFSDSDGNRWISPNLELEQLEELENNIRTFVMIVKYKSSSVTPIGSEMIEVGKPIN